MLLRILSLAPVVFSVLIDSKLGSLKGAEFTATDGSLIHAFKHVPFAQPPVGQLRYALPEPALPWKGARDATNYGPACMSNTTTPKNGQTWVDEDCLHVNIFTSDRCLKSQNCPVVFYVHGGDFNFDSAVMFPDDILVENFGSGDVLLVISAFRLGFTGLLSFGNDNVVPRNLPIYDILLSLNWVQDNIHSFGGDKKRVTLFGHSGGGTAVAAIAFSKNIDPKRKLFHQIVVMSGAMTLPSDELQHRKLGLEFVKRAGCNPYVNVGEPSDNFVREMVDCMRKKDAHELLGIQREMEDERKMISGFLLTKPLFSSKTLLELRENAPKISLITGNTWHEMNHLHRDYVVTIADSLGFRNPTAVAKKFKQDSKEGNLSFNCTGSETQSLFVISQQTAAALTKTGSKCYLYSYRYWRHPRHTDDLSYLMGVHRFEPDENEAVLAKLYPQYFLNFVKTGIPDPDWEPYRPEDDNYYSVDVNLKTGLMPKNALHFENMLPLLLLSVVTLVSAKTIDCKLGSLKGVEFNAKDGSLVHAFKHVPFAQPPVGQLRYALPQPALSWDGVRDATTYGPACMTNSTTSKSPQKWVDEDCLHVNIFTSDRCLKSKNCAVVFYVHGGGFNYDSAVMFPDDALVENFGSKDVVLVVSAFRLGFSGLLTFGNDNIVPRNLPLHDIILSLNWVQDNIKYFGGDRKKVTLLGHSGGGTAVLSLAFSRNIDPKRKLFRGVIGMSAPMALQASELNHRSMALDYIKRAGCLPFSDVGEPSDNFIREMVDCMRTKDGHQLLAIQRQMEEEGLEIEGFLLTEPLFSSSTVAELLANAPKVSLLTGATWFELNTTPTDYSATIADTIGYKNPMALAEKYEKDGKEGKLTGFNSTSETQSIFVSARNVAAAMSKAGAKSYLYSYRNWRHPKHTDDLSYLMGVHRFEPDENEAVIAKLYPQYFLNFVKTGVPDSDWESFRPEDDNYYAVDVNMKTGLMPKNELHFEQPVIDYWTKEMAVYDAKVTTLRNPVKPKRRAVAVPATTDEPSTEESEESVEYAILSWFYDTIVFGMVLLAGVLLGRLSAPRQIIVQMGADERTPLFLK